MVSTHGDDTRPGLLELGGISFNMFYRYVIVHRFRQRRVASVIDPDQIPRRYAEAAVTAPVEGGNVSDRARPQMLIALG